MVGLTTLFEPASDCFQQWAKVSNQIYEQYGTSNPARTSCFPPGYVSPAIAHITGGWPGAFKPGTGGCPIGYEANLSLWSKGYPCGASSQFTPQPDPSGMPLPPWSKKGTVYCCPSGFSFDHCAKGGVGGRVACVETGKFVLGPLKLEDGGEVTTGTAWGSLVVLVNDAGPTDIPGETSSSSSTSQSPSKGPASETCSTCKSSGSSDSSSSSRSSRSSRSSESDKSKSETKATFTSTIVTIEVSTFTSSGTVVIITTTRTSTETLIESVPGNIETSGGNGNSNGNGGGTEKNSSGGGFNGLSIGAKAGIIIGGSAVVLLALIFAIFLILRYRKRRRQERAWIYDHQAHPHSQPYDHDPDIGTALAGSGRKAPELDGAMLGTRIEADPDAAVQYGMGYAQWEPPAELPMTTVTAVGNISELGGHGRYREGGAGYQYGWGMAGVVPGDKEKDEGAVRHEVGPPRTPPNESQRQIVYQLPAEEAAAQKRKSASIGRKAVPRSSIPAGSPVFQEMPAPETRSLLS